MAARLFCNFATGWTRTNNNFFGQNPWVSEQYNITPYGCYDRTLLDFVKGFRLPNSFPMFSLSSIHAKGKWLSETPMWKNVSIVHCANDDLCDEVVGVSLINLGCPLSCPKDIIDSRCISIDPRVYAQFCKSIHRSDLDFCLMDIWTTLF